MVVTFYRHESPLIRYTFVNQIQKEHAVTYAKSDFEKEFKLSNWRDLATEYHVN
jgi:hypothetical protein